MSVGFLAQVQISCFFFSYLVSLAGEIFQLLRARTVAARWLVIGFTAAGLLAHTAYLVTRSQAIGLPPLMSSSQDWLLVLAWLGVVLYLVLLATHGEWAHGVFLLPAILILVTVAVFVSRDATRADLQQLAIRRWGMLHAASLVLGMAAVVGATLSALMYLLNHQKLRSRATWLRRLQLPSLEQLTQVNRGMVIVSVPCLTVGLVTGFILLIIPRTGSVPVEFRWSDPTIVTTVLFWCVMTAMVVRLVAIRRQSGKAIAQMSLLSGGFLLVTILGPMLLAQSGAIKTFHGGGSESSGAVPAAPAGSLAVPEALQP